MTLSELGLGLDGVQQWVSRAADWAGLHEYALLALLLLAAGWACSLALARKPAASRFEGTASAELRRRRINNLRTSSKLFTPPFPNGWYCLCRSSDLQKGEVVPVAAFGREVVCFRGRKDGKVGVLHAFCPHLGTHLGYGGHVEKDSIVCPYHSWSFNRSGQCTQIPYTERSIDSFGQRVNAKSYPCVEAAGCVLAWFHADGADPWYQPTLLQELESARMKFVGDFEVDDWHMHLTEPSQNACDWYHFKTVHQWLGQQPSAKLKWIWVQHACKTHMNLLGKNPNGDHRCIRDSLSPKGELLPPEMIVLEESPVIIRLFGWLPVPGPLFRHFKAEAWFQGPQLSVFRVRSWLFGESRTIFCFTPEKPFLQRCICRSYCSWRMPEWLGRFLARNGIATIEQDRRVWENKLTCNPRNLVTKDGPFAAYGTWVKQFYSESSASWDGSLDW